MAETTSPAEVCGEKMDVSSMFAILWRRKRLIVLGTFIATLLSLIITLILPKVYRSEAFYQLGNPYFKFEGYQSEKPSLKQEEYQLENTSPKFGENIRSKTNKEKPIGLEISLFKSSSSQFFDPNRIYVAANKEKSFSEKELNTLKKDLKSAADINRWIKPVYAFAREDAREFTQMPTDETNAVLGIKLTYEADSPELAAVYVNFFGSYIRDCLLHMTLVNYIMDGYSKSATNQREYENAIIRLQFEIVQNTAKLKDFQKILSDYPESGMMETRQGVSIQQGGARFLAPVTQLVGIESTLADIRRNLDQIERDREKLSVRYDFFARSFNELEKAGGNGESLFRLVKSIKNDVFRNKDLDRSELKEVFNDLSIDLQQFDYIFYQKSRFISGPIIPTVHVKPYKSIIVVVAFVASLAFFLVMALVIECRQINKQDIVPPKSEI